MLANGWWPRCGEITEPGECDQRKNKQNPYLARESQRSLDNRERTFGFQVSVRAASTLRMSGAADIGLRSLALAFPYRSSRLLNRWPLLLRRPLQELAAALAKVVKQERPFHTETFSSE